MKSEKGKPAFAENVDAVLTDKIIEHTQKNTEGGGRENSVSSPDLPSQNGGCCGNMSKSRCMYMCFFFALFLAGIIAFFIARPKFMKMKKRNFLHFFK
jgi:hypothetical protein